MSTVIHKYSHQIAFNINRDLFDVKYSKIIVIDLLIMFAVNILTSKYSSMPDSGSNRNHRCCHPFITLVNFINGPSSGRQLKRVKLALK